MAQDNHSANLYIGKFEPSQRLKTLAFAFVAIGVIGFLVGLMKNQERLWTSYLVAFFFTTCMGLGGLFWASVQNISKAGWSVSIRRLSEGMTAFLPMILIGGLVLLGGVKILFPWANPDVVAHDPAIAVKSAYLNVTFLVIRLVVFGLLMLFFGKKIVGNSLKQDQTGDETLTHKNVGWSVAWVIIFALSFSLFSVDLLMSLLPTWYSTIFGIYCFAGLFQGSLALLVLMIIYVRRAGFVRGYINDEHMHDVAKFTKGFTVFWAYIAFSQFMLIWYANIPEETEFFILRATEGWMAISMALLIFKFVVPFLLLLPRAAKRNENHLILVCSLLVVMQYLDVYWMVYPNFFNNHVTFGFYEIAMLLLFVGIFMLLTMKFFQKNNLVAIKDPRMHEALSHQVTY
jgi:hypothetical protein